MKKLLAIICLSGVVSAGIWCQDVAGQVTDKIYIKNAHITVRPGVEMEKASIILNHGLIEQIGTNLAVPYDAKIIDADSLYIYAGFIAPLSQVGIPKPKEQNNRPRVKRPGYPPNDVAGITPEKTVQNVYDASEGQIDDLRKQGFGIAQIVPYGRMMPGQAAIVSLNGKPFNEAVIRDASALFAKFEGTRGVFPATIIGIMAKWREMHEQATLALDHQAAYDKNPLNLQRPTPDAAIEALYPVIKGEMSVLFLTPKHVDIFRAIQLKKDLALKLVIGEVAQGNMALDEIKENVEVSLLSLDLPKAIEKKKEDKSEDVQDPEKERLESRKAASIMNYESQAKLFAENEIPFAFSFLEVNSRDIHTNIKRMIKAGLTPGDALAALTTAAAQTLGIGSFAGSLEKGKVANLVVSTKPIFTEDAEIRMVFVDGQQFDLPVKKKKSKDAGDEVVDLEGTWDYEIEIPGMMPKGTMTFKKAGENYDVDLTNDQNGGEVISVKNVELEGNEMSFEYDVNAGGTTVRVMTEVTFSGNQLEGDVTVADFGTFALTGEKSSKPE